MRAVNLIPVDDRRGGGGGSAGRSGGMVYVALGALALVVVLFAASTKVGASVSDKQAQLAAVEQQATAAQAQTTALQKYTAFAALRTSRVQTVKQLAAARFDWAGALHEFSRVLPANAWISQLTGTTSPAVTVEGGSGSGGLRQNLAVPALEVTGCTTSQASVAKMIARMRLINGVERVSLSDASKSDSSGGTGSGGCGSSSHFPTFHLVVFFSAPATSAPAAGASTATAATSTTTPAATTTAPATTSTTSTTGATP